MNDDSASEETANEETANEETANEEMAAGSDAEAEVSEAEVAEAEVSEPEVAEPEVAEAEVAEPEVVEAEVVEPDVAEPEVAEPDAHDDSDDSGGERFLTPAEAAALYVPHEAPHEGVVQDPVPYQAPAVAGADPVLADPVPAEPVPAEPEPALSSPPKAGGKFVAIIGAGLLVLVGAGYVAAHASADNRIPLRTTVAGVDIGGRTPEVALDKLQAELGPRLDRAIPLSVNGSEATLSPGQTGFSVSFADTVADAGARSSWSPNWLFEYFTGRQEVEPRSTLDAQQLESALADVAAGAIRAPQEGAIEFKGAKISITDPVVGQQVDVDSAQVLLTEAFLAGSPQVIDLPLVPAVPDIDESDIANAMSSFANPAMSAPVVLKFGKSPVKVRPADYASALTMVPANGELVPAYDRKILRSLVGERVASPDAPVDATVRLVNGKPKVIPAKPGVTYRGDAVEAAFAQAVVGDGTARKVAVEGEVAEPEFTTADAKALKIKERVSSFTTYFPYAEYRNINIGRAAALVDGTLLKPGEVFSLNDIVGERTRENGFTEGFIISNGVFKEDLGGGVSQMATTTFNAAFFAGLKDIEHKPHSFFIDRYPAGREATVAWGAVDLRFENDTKYGVLINSYVIPGNSARQGTVVVEMYSTKTWDITTSSSARYNATSPKEQTFYTDDCVPNIGYGGFDIDVYRYFKKPGASAITKTERFFTRYIPADTVICKLPEEDPALQED